MSLTDVTSRWPCHERRRLDDTLSAGECQHRDPYRIDATVHARSLYRQRHINMVPASIWSPLSSNAPIRVLVVAARRATVVRSATTPVPRKIEWGQGECISLTTSGLITKQTADRHLYHQLLACAFEVAWYT